MAKKVQPWDRLERETVRAYAAFCTYLHLGVGRTIDAAAKVGTGIETRAHRRSWFVWSAKNDWVERVGAFDLHEAAKKYAERDQVREVVRQRIIDESLALASSLIRIATGKEKNVSSSRMAAIKLALKLAGIEEPRHLEISGPKGGPLQVLAAPLDKALDGLSDEQLKAIVSMRQSQPLALEGADDE